MAFPALNHVALTVRDMAVSGPWYRRLLGADPVVDEHTAAGFRHLVWILDGGTVFGIHQHEHPAPDERFSEFRVGLDHVGFGCADRADWRPGWTDSMSCGIQHGGIVDAPYGSGLSFRDPGRHRAGVLCAATGMNRIDQRQRRRRRCVSMGR